ncbi:MAG: geranylgeranyl reductase family protein, partial [Acidimicrobiales bacterium]|nr:geranylgeranyl reductase family protein [Acidimicrobiales bacterium]
EKTCGDGLTPRAVTQIKARGHEGKIAANHHRYDGLRCIAHGTTLELTWPDHPVHPSHGYVVRRRDLDAMVAAEAEAQGASLLQGTEALQPIYRDGLLRGAVVKDKATGEEREVHARYVVIADGSLSRFGRALGNQRDKRLVQGTAIRGYFESPLHADPWIESALDVRDRNGDAMPGYGWIFPCGDGTINVGIGLLSTFRGWREINTTHLMHEWAATAPEHWGIDPDAMLEPATGGRLPMAGSIHPKSGPTWIAVGDAAGSINPFNGEGIDYAYETGRMAAELIDEALEVGSAMPLARYPDLLEAEYGLYFRVARAFAVVIGQPALMQQLTRVGVQSQSLMEWVLRIMANLLRPEEVGPAEAAYKAVAAIARIVPERIPA